MFPYRDMRSVCAYGDTEQGYPSTELCARLQNKRTNCAVLPEATALPTHRSTVSRTTSGSEAHRLSRWTAEASGPEPVANTQVRVYLVSWISGSSHDPSHALHGRILTDPSRSCS